MRVLVGLVSVSSYTLTCAFSRVYGMTMKVEARLAVTFKGIKVYY
jgi:hypothetical protein